MIFRSKYQSLRCGSWKIYKKAVRFGFYISLISKRIIVLLFRLQGLQNTDNCELLYFTYEDIESVLALDIDYRFTILYGLESVM